MGEVERVCLPLQKTRREESWTARVSRATLSANGLAHPQDAPLYYGYRVWGPNWNHRAEWRPGRAEGFVADVDAQGHRFNPNKLLLDPYALEVSHGLEKVSDIRVFNSGSESRFTDSAPFAPKGVLTALESRLSQVAKPTRALKEDVIYEVHLKGFTANDPSVPFMYRGTFKGAALKAAYLRRLGVTAVEFLPIHQMINTRDNYWGYMPLAYFSPQNSYAFDQSPGGPAREFREMVDEFHRHDLKVILDVVYNHTGEGGLWAGDPNVAQLVSFRGLDNASYYTLSRDPFYYMDHTGCGNDLAGDQEVVRNLVIDSLAYWKNQMGVDGFRFDLASVLANTARGGSFYFEAGDPKNVLNRARFELPLRPAPGGEGVDLIAEPWALGYGTYQLGRFPSGWAEWNGGAFRDPVRAFLNKRGVVPVTLGEMAHAISGSANLFETSGRKPWHSLNFIVAHDGFTLRDLFSYNSKNNAQPPPFGPSDGGTDDNRSWDQNGDERMQRQLTRTAFVTLLMSIGTPMIVGGDEFYRTLRGNNNPYNLDTVANYLSWPDHSSQSRLTGLVTHLLRLRAEVEGLRPMDFLTGYDGNGNGVKAITWHGPDGREMERGDFNQTDGFIGYRIDNTEFDKSEIRSILVLINADFRSTTLHLPDLEVGAGWYQSVDTAAWLENQGNHFALGLERRVDGTYYVNARSAVVLIEKAISPARSPQR